ncbi:MAG: DUF58 domain-containing protein [Planctomycetota bacterium]|jgi:uncharacterized protein (DUF58 family)|nr:DUF58 domain-containing protein [Planctomycetota bacterium]
MRRAERIALAGRLAAPCRLPPPGRTGGGRQGFLGGAAAGQSAEFHDFREYRPGDDLRRVDWRGYARTGQMRLILFREEASPEVELLLDVSASMAAYPGKEQAAIFIAAFLCAAALAAEGRPVLCRDGRRFGAGEFAEALLATRFAGGDPAPAPAGSPAAKPLRFYLGDCLFADDVGRRFDRQAAGSLLFHPIMLLAQSEINPPWRGVRRLVDVEAPADAGLDLPLSEAVIARYRSRLGRHEEALARAAGRNGGRLLRLDVPDGELTPADCGELVRRLVAEKTVAGR